MPHFHHKRRHSWPYCSSGIRLRERRNLPIITVTGPPDEVEFEFEGQFLTPVETEALLEDDAASAGIIRSQSSHSHRLWHHAKESGHAQINPGSASLRKMIQPPLDRARSLFVLPTIMSAGETVLLPYWVHRLAAHPIVTKERARTQDGSERGRLINEKNHRRCHSERPRSWKQPSEKLWTLKEE